MTHLCNRMVNLLEHFKLHRLAEVDAGDFCAKCWRKLFDLDIFICRRWLPFRFCRMWHRKDKTATFVSRTNAVEMLLQYCLRYRHNTKKSGGKANVESPRLKISSSPMYEQSGRRSCGSRIVPLLAYLHLGSSWRSPLRFAICLVSTRELVGL